MPTLDPSIEFRKLRDMYAEDPRSNTTTVLVSGYAGSGKTRFAKTCVAPVYLAMFDPRGEQTVKKDIDNGRIIPDTRFEFKKWKGRAGPLMNLFLNEIGRMEQGGLFEHIGTLFIDSFSTMSVALLDACGKDWQEWSERFQLIISDLNALPCHIVLTSHLEIIKDEVTGRAEAHMYTPGRVKYWIPGLFSEKYVLNVTGAGDAAKYTLITKNTGYFKCSTRIGANGIFKAEEEPDMKALLKKAGLPHKDKPLFNKGEVKSA